jgi:hypothetical protein
MDASTIYERTRRVRDEEGNDYLVYEATIPIHGERLPQRSEVRRTLLSSLETAARAIRAEESQTHEQRDQQQIRS